MGDGDGVPSPSAMADAGSLPRVLCFALSARERAAVLRVLRGYGRTRSAALLAALGVTQDQEHAAGGEGGSRGD